MSDKSKISFRIKQMTALAVFAALAYAVHFIHIPVMFLNLDFKDVIMTIGGMYFGPIAGLVLAIIVPLLEFPTSETMMYGLIMNWLSSISFVFIASIIYRFKRTFLGAIIALISAACTMVAAMMVANLFITPYYMGVDRATVVSLIPKLLLPFNAIKAILNAAITLCIYKPITAILKRAGIGKAISKNEGLDEAQAQHNKMRSMLVWIIGGVIIIAAFAVVFFVLDGKFMIGS